MGVSVSEGRCSKCGSVLTAEYLTNDGSRKPCPNCGSMGRDFNVHVTETIHIKEQVAYKLKRQGKGKPAVEAKSGDSLRVDDGKWLKIEQVVDRENNKYKKKIVDPETGEVIRDEEGKLTDHQGYGSAKKPKSTNP